MRAFSMAASQAASGGCQRMRRCGRDEEAGFGRRLMGLPSSRSRFSGGMAMLLAWVLLAAPPCQGALMKDSRVPGSFRGGSISWMPVSPGSDTVRVTVHTAWLRSAGTFVRMVDGVAKPEEGYQPRKGDVIKVLGPETPRFITFGMEKYLEVTVTSATEQVAGNRSNIGAGKPHTNADWSYWANNWFEGVSVYEVTLPRRDETYVAEVHGCCRMQDMCRNDENCRANMVSYVAAEPPIPNYRDSVGIWSNYDTHFHLTATIRLDRDPPPVFYLPHFVPFIWSENGELQDLELPVLDFMASRGYVSQQVYEENPEQWPDMVVREGEEREGSLAGTQSKPTTGGAGRRLLSTPFQRGLNESNLEVLPPMLQTHPVVSDTSVTGQDVRLLMAPENMVRLFPAAGCQGEEHADIPANMDVCPGSAHQFYPGGARIEANFLSLSVPPGLAIDVSDACEFSQPPPSTTAGFHFGNLIGSGCDNRAGTSRMCCSLPAGSMGRMLRARAQTKNVPTSLKILGNSWLKIYYSPVAEGRTKVVLRVEEVPIRDESGQEVLRRSAPDGNWAVRLKLATPTSSSTTVEFILHVQSLVEHRVKQQTVNQADGSPRFAYTGFETINRVEITPDENAYSGKIFFDNIGHLFGQHPPVPVPGRIGGVGLETLETGRSLTWTPCTESMGIYWVCTFAMQAISPYDWAPMACIFVRVAQDLPPEIRFTEKGNSKDRVDRFSLRMGETLRVNAQAIDNPVDTLGFFKLTSIDTAAGDSIRSHVEYVYDKLGGGISPGIIGAKHAGQPRKVARLIEPLLPDYLRLSILPVDGSNKFEVNREVVFQPSRQHSGLHMDICFLAVDSQGACKAVGSGTKKCFVIHVERCVYVMQAGESLTSVAGLFETSWLQLFALNPTFHNADAPVRNDTAIAVGHPYAFGQGETLHSVIRMFGSDIQHVLLLNADLNRLDAVSTKVFPVGYELCVLPNTCGVI